ncbi:MAG: C25 family cysteine peptidase [Agriterribacter sp.]
MKQLLSILLLLCCTLAKAQYNNEWIDYGKTYYKFKVAKDGLHRIPQSSLQTIGLGNTPAEQFQLWRNGAQVPVYTSVATGALDGNGYIEFWGEMNDGKPDKNLYYNINFQLCDKWSLETDTASYFLTVNPDGNNLRFTTAANNVNGSPLSPDPYFMHTEGQYFKNKINAGYAGIVGEYVYSSVYDKGEGYSSDDIYPGGGLSQTINNLYPYAGGPDGIFYIAASGNANNNRTLRVRVNNTQLVDATMDSFNDQKQQVSLPAALLSSGTAKVDMINTSANPNDRMVVAKFELTYARQFNFGGASNFVFNLVANTNGNLLRISNFNTGAAVPVLYDLTNFTRYEGNTAEAGVIRFALLPSAQQRKLVLVSGHSSNITSISTFVTRNFVNYAQANNQGDYIIISNPLLYAGPNGNPVEAYRQYRASGTGGGYNAKVYDIDQLTDQFAFGIKRHPFAVKNFIKYAVDVFEADPRAVLLIGKGVSYNQAKQNESSPLLEKMNLIPPFGYPASDNLLGARDNQTIADIPLGRISAVTPTEVEIYLNKVKEFESISVSAPQTIEGRGWMKNIVHAIGGGDAELSAQIGGYMNQLRNIIQDTLYGGNVKSFSKTSAVASQLTSEGLKALFAEGIGILNYFGHSSASVIEFNIDDPGVYDNQGKYPFFLVNGCLAGDIFNFEPTRLSAVLTLSEKYIFADKKGCIGFVASTHFGIVNYLNTYLNGMYDAIARKEYGASNGELLEQSFRYMLDKWTGDYFARLHAEEITLHGDPVVKLYTSDKADFIVEDASVKLPPTLSVTDNSFLLQVKFMNIGKGINDSFNVNIKRVLPDGSEKLILVKRIPGRRYADSISINIPINPAIEKGENKIVVVLDFDDKIPEMSEANNNVTKVFHIIDDGVNTIYPYNFSIVNKQNFSFYASTANPIADMQTYNFEIDTTENFNSAFKKTSTANTATNILEFKPGVSLTDSTVYYWRVAKAVTTPATVTWSTASFIYLSNSSEGYSQGHYFQHKKSNYDSIWLDDQRVFDYNKKEVHLKARIGLYPTYTYDKVDVALDENLIAQWMCEFNVLQFVIIDGKTAKPWINYNVTPGEGRFGSRPICHTPPYSFAFLMSDSSQRRKAMEMLEGVPTGNYIMIYWTGVGKDAGWIGPNTTFIDAWKSDEMRLGGKSLYKTFINFGLTEIDKFTQNLPFLFMFKKGDSNYPIFQRIGNNVDEHIIQSFPLEGAFFKGSVSSPWFGPAIEWSSLRWDGRDIESASDSVAINIYGRSPLGDEARLGTIRNSRDTTLSFIDAEKYPYLKLKLSTKDEENATPYQLRYWRLVGKLPPEGVIYPDVNFLLKDSVEIGEQLNIKMSFKNISAESFDSLKMKIGIIDNNNTTREIILPKGKKLITNDTITITYLLDTKNYPGLNTLFVYFNPDNDQPEQYAFNNFIYKTFYVKSDTYKPLLDVTFDGVHILNDDIVSAKPHILINLKDDSKFMPLDDTSLLKIQVRYPNGVYRNFSFSNDTLRFTPPATTNGSTNDNTATIDFKPDFFDDGNYELVVSARDKSNNGSGLNDYRVGFKVINKPMISNMFNYPNPFTTSTAFVFTLTGSEVPQNLRVQVLTITGKIVREITREELGPIRIGRNITEFKWDGTDQYGQKLANGVYLYRVITNLNGKSLERYKTEGDNTDQYFNKGYGKMYLMR